jgi:putative nucleotidyltransferase with HDIG domain
MRMTFATRAFVAAVVGCGAGAAAFAAVHEHVRMPYTFGLLAVGAIVTELLQVRPDANDLDGGELHAFSFSSGVHLAALMILGPSQAVLVAAGGVLVVDYLQGSARMRVAFNASAFGLATLAAGLLYDATGAVPGRLALPRDFVSIALMALVYIVVNRGLVAVVVSLASQLPLAQLLRDALRSELSAAAGETSVGIVLAFSVLTNPWTVIALAPLAMAVYQAHARLAAMKSETARALETFATVIDERDASTYEHSKRVADLVDRLGVSLRLPPRDVARLRWAARLHDLGKIAVDASVLRKPGKLAPAEWNTIKRHPRLSSELLHRFRFASTAARAVEYHHERYDGRGYYGIDAREIPLGAHLLAVADSFDAMVADRPYHAGLPVDDALLEIERSTGSQFHPIAAKAFVAMQRGEDPLAALDGAERAGLRELWLSRRRTPAGRLAALRCTPETVAIAAIAETLAAVSVGRPWLVLPGAAAGLSCLLLVRRRSRLRARLADALRVALETDVASLRFPAFATALGRVAGARWVSVVRWNEEELTGDVEQQASFAWSAPTVGALVSGLVRDGRDGDAVVRLSSAYLDGGGSYVAAPVLDDARIRGYVVAAFPRAVPSFVEDALASLGEQLELLLPHASSASGARRLAPVEAVR